MGGAEGVSRSPDGLFAQQEREPIRGRPAVRGKRTYGGWPGQRVEEQGTWASQKHSEAGYGRAVDRGVWTAKTVKRPPQQPAQPPIRQLLGAADTQTAHPATFSTAPTHQRLGSANAETTPAGAPAAAADRTQRPDVMSHRGGAHAEPTTGEPGQGYATSGWRRHAAKLPQDC